MKRAIRIGGALVAALMVVPGMAAAQGMAAEQGVRAGIAAQSWIAVEAGTGKILAEKDSAARSKIGGLPKLMTALIVARLAAADPRLLDERLEFSEAMVKVPGTTTGLQAGESLTVRDALHGLLLGPANDAAMALARRFNGNFAPSNFRHLEQVSAHSRAFIAEMNRTARSLQMGDSIFRSSFVDGGDSDARTSTARDLALLTAAAMRDPLLAKIVGTRTYAATVGKPGGGTRSQSWNNGNRLLGVDGVGGGMVTSTPGSGHSVVVSATRGGKAYIVVVLGSPSAQQRFADARAILTSIK